MFRAKTVFVLGAGASVEVGLPVGADLLKKIVELINIRYDHGRMISGDHIISRALKTVLNEGHEVEKYNLHLHAAWQLAASSKQALSIDNVIDALEDEKVELVGKIGIVRAILESEKSSRFFRPDQNHHEGIDLDLFENTWYASFLQLLTENIKKSQISETFDNIEIVNFNYDRCLENYLPLAISNYYGIKSNKAQELMSGLVIHRPYGIAGRLPWQAGDMPSVQFGSSDAEQVASVAQQIRTFTERVEEGEALAGIRASISNAERIIFLGFAFHRQNVELIRSAARSNVEILATTFEISNSDQGVIDSELKDAFSLSESGKLHHNYIEMANLKCHELFKNYWRTLTAGPGEEPYDMMESVRRPAFQMPQFPNIDFKNILDKE